MPDVAIEKKAVLDLLPDGKPKQSATSDMPVIETKPDVEVKKAATEEVKKEDVSATPDKPESPSAEPEAPKAKGVQKRLDELTRNWRDEQRARERSEKLLADAMETMKRLAEGKPAHETKADSDDPEPAEPDVKGYTDQEKYNTDYRGYLREQAKWVARQEFKTLQKQDTEERQKRTREEQGRSMAETYQKHVSKAKEKYPDYEEMAGDPTLPIARPMADAIVEAGELGPEIVVHLHQNREEAERIYKLSPRGQFLEIGKLAAKLSQGETKVAPVSQAPKPIKPLTTGTGAATSSDEESMEAYAAKRTKQLQEENRRGVRR